MAGPSSLTKMDIQGSCLAFPFAADQRGTLATVSAREKIVEQSILSIISTRKGERVMLPEYGLPDYVFATVDAGFIPRVAYFLRQQILTYEPLAEEVHVTVGSVEADAFAPGFSLDAGRAALRVEFKVRGAHTPRNLVFPTWELRRS